MEWIEKCQDLHEKYIDWLGDIYEKMYQQQEDFHQQYHDRMTNIAIELESMSQLIYLHNHLISLCLLHLHHHLLMFQALRISLLHLQPFDDDSKGEKKRTS